MDNSLSTMHKFSNKTLWKSSQRVHMVVRVLTEFFRLSDGLANRSFCRSDIWRVQLKSNWAVRKRLLASDCKAILKKQDNFIESKINFFLMAYLKIHLFRKNWLWRNLWMMSYCTQGTAQTFRWSCKPIILSIGHFEGPNEVQLNSWWKTVSLWPISS